MERSPLESADCHRKILLTGTSSDYITYGRCDCLQEAIVLDEDMMLCASDLGVLYDPQGSPAVSSALSG